MFRALLDLAPPEDPPDPQRPLDVALVVTLWIVSWVVILVAAVLLWRALT